MVSLPSPFAPLSLNQKLAATPPFPNPCLAPPRLVLHHNFSKKSTWAAQSGPIYAASVRSDHNPMQEIALDEKNYEFKDEDNDVELRIQLPYIAGLESSVTDYISVNAEAGSLQVVFRGPEDMKVLLAADNLYGKIKPADTVWYLDENVLVVNMKKLDNDLFWPGLIEDWGTLSKGVAKLLKGTSVYVVGESTDINWEVARAMATGLRYIPLQTKQIMEEFAKCSIVELAEKEGDDAVFDLENSILSTLNSHVRAVVATLGEKKGVAIRFDGWQRLHAGVTIWLSQTQAKDEREAENEASAAKRGGVQAYAKAEVVVALGGWEEGAAHPAAEGCLRALKYLLETDKELIKKKNLYVRLGCRGDWPNIEPSGWDVSNGETMSKAIAL